MCLASLAQRPPPSVLNCVQLWRQIQSLCIVLLDHAQHIHTTQHPIHKIWVVAGPLMLACACCDTSPKSQLQVWKAQSRLCDTPSQVPLRRVLPGCHPTRGAGGDRDGARTRVCVHRGPPGCAAGGVWLLHGHPSGVLLCDGRGWRLIPTLQGHERESLCLGPVACVCLSHLWGWQGTSCASLAPMPMAS